MAGRPAGAIPAASDRVAALLPTAAGTFAAAAERAVGAAGIAVAVGGLDVPAPATAVRVARSRPAGAVGVTGASFVMVAPTTSLYGRGRAHHDNPGAVGAAAAAFASG
jgi:hypothetical protein